MFGELGYVPLTWPVAETLTDPSIAEFQDARPQAVAKVDPNQFTLFQLADLKADEPLRDLHSVQATLKGSDEKPDVQVRLELMSFQIAATEGLLMPPPRRSPASQTEPPTVRPMTGSTPAPTLSMKTSCARVLPPVTRARTTR
jgi:hypothetical protein